MIYKFDLLYMMVLFSWNYFGFFNFIVNFGIGEGMLVYDEVKLVNFSVEVSLLLVNFDIYVSVLDEYLKKFDFFDVVKYLVVIFKSICVELLGGNKFKVIGDFIVYGVIKLVVLDVMFNKVGM